MINARIIALSGILALMGCDSPMMHQDRPGGTDYQGGYAPSGQPPAYRSTQDLQQGEATPKERREMRRRCDNGVREACDWLHRYD